MYLGSTLAYEINTTINSTGVKIDRNIEVQEKSDIEYPQRNN